MPNGKRIHALEDLWWTKAGSPESVSPYASSIAFVYQIPSEVIIMH